MLESLTTKTACPPQLSSIQVKQTCEPPFTDAAWILARHTMLRIASITRSRSFGRTVAVSLITCDTVPMETPARSAICRIFTGAVMTCHVEARRMTSSLTSMKSSPRDHGKSRPRSESRLLRSGPCSWRHQQQLSVLDSACKPAEIPDRSLRLIVTAAAENAAARVIIQILLRPLPDVSQPDPLHRMGLLLRMSIDRIRTAHGADLSGTGTAPASHSLPHG